MGCGLVIWKLRVSSLFFSLGLDCLEQGFFFVRKVFYPLTSKLPMQWEVYPYLQRYIMIVPTDVDENKFHLSIEEYLHSLISLINELVSYPYSLVNTIVSACR